MGCGVVTCVGDIDSVLGDLIPDSTRFNRQIMGNTGRSYEVATWLWFC